MAQRAADQITLVDLTDGYTVILSNESHSFPGTTSSAEAGSATSKIQAFRGSDVISASVDVAAITGKPTGMTITSDNHATAPTLTFAVTTALTSGGTLQIPVIVDGVTIIKGFTYTIAFKGATGATGTSATNTGLLNEAQMIPTNASGVTTAAQTVNVGFFGYVGANRAAVTAAVQGTLPSGITIGTNTPGTTSADGVLTLNIASGTNLPGDTTNLVIRLTCNSQVRDYVLTLTKAKQGPTGSAGADAITVEVDSSGGLIFKNSQVATTLTARVYKGGIEQTSTQVATLGTVRWYKDGGTTSVGTGLTLAVTAGQVTDRATYEARLEN